MEKIKMSKESGMGQRRIGMKLGKRSEKCFKNTSNKQCIGEKYTKKEKLENLHIKSNNLII